MSRYDRWRAAPLDELEHEIRVVQARFKQRRVLPADMQAERIYLANLKTIAADKRRKEGRS